MNNPGYTNHAGAAPELAILIGLPGSGKTTWYDEHLAATHVHVSKDLMPNARNRDARQRKMIEDALTAGRSVAVDNTNPTVAVRAPLIDMGRRHGARIVAYYFEIPVQDALGRNRQREGRDRVPDVAIFVTAKKLAAPSFEEGFAEIHVIAPAAAALQT